MDEDKSGMDKSEAKRPSWQANQPSSFDNFAKSQQRSDDTYKLPHQRTTSGSVKSTWLNLLGSSLIWTLIVAVVLLIIGLVLIYLFKV